MILVVNAETGTHRHNCFESLVVYLHNMIQSKEFVIKAFKDEIKIKNNMIIRLIQRQDQLEKKLDKLSFIMEYEDKKNEEASPSVAETLEKLSDINQQVQLLIKDVINLDAEEDSDENTLKLNFD